MNDNAIKRLEKMVDFYHNFLELEPEERAWLLIGMSPGVERTIEMLELIKENCLTYDELAELTGLHHNTVKQKLLALKRGGFPLNMTETSAIAEVGRPRKLARRINEKDLIHSLEKIILQKAK